MPSNDGPLKPPNFEVFRQETLEPRRPPHHRPSTSHQVTRIPREIIMVKEFKRVKNLPSVCEDSPRITFAMNSSVPGTVGMDHQELSQDIASMSYQELVPEKTVMFTEGLSQESSPQIRKDVQERNIIFHQESPPEMTKVVQDRNVIVHKESSPPMTRVVGEKNIMTKVVQERNVIGHQESIPQTTKVFEKKTSPQKTSIFHQLSFP